ncbi:MAG: MBL fold metallo-hydrolase, partial [Desulfohalobiaceae bacterium]
MPGTKLTILCENTAGSMFGITGEHGFSALVEKGEQKILFDTGQGFSLQHNARMLGLRLEEVGHIVLSHGHYDHTGGLSQALYPPRGVRITAHPDVFQSKYAVLQTSAGQQSRYIGLPYSREYLEGSLGCSWDLRREFCELGPGIFFSGEVPREQEYEVLDPRLQVLGENGLQPDPLWDDASLLLETDSGPVVLLGCAHAGIINILRHFSSRTGHTSFKAVIGGTHLGVLEPGEKLDRILKALDGFGLELVGVSHCTGPKAAAIGYQYFQERFAFANAGWSA